MLFNRSLNLDEPEIENTGIQKLGLFYRPGGKAICLDGWALGDLKPWRTDKQDTNTGKSDTSRIGFL